MGYKTDDDIPEQLGPGYKLGYLQCRQNFQSFMIFLFTNFFFSVTCAKHLVYVTVKELNLLNIIWIGSNLGDLHFTNICTG